MRGNHNTVNAVHVNPHQTLEGVGEELRAGRFEVEGVCGLMCLVSKRMDDGSYNTNILLV